jgi:hypothetical protein
VFVASELAGANDDGADMRPASEIASRDFDHILYQIGNEPHHAFMLPLVRELGGAVVLHDWTLSLTSWAADPALAHGGMRGLFAALREGGVGEARHYFAHGAVLRREEAARARLTLNRTVVRCGDAFLVHHSDLKRRILIDRNAATPIAVLKARDDAYSLAREYASFLEICPSPRSKRRSLIRAMVEASDKRRNALAGSDTEDPTTSSRRSEKSEPTIAAERTESASSLRASPDVIDPM